MIDIFDKINFIVFEGIDCSGKTTIINELSKIIYDIYNKNNKQRDIYITKEPTEDSIFGRRLVEHLNNKILDSNKELEFYIEDRNIHIKNILYRKNNFNSLCLCDRFNLSTLVYQSTFNDFSIQYIKNKIDIMLDNNLIPCVTFILDISLETYLKRIKYRKDISIYEKDIDKIEIMKEKYIELVDCHKNIFLINANQKVNKIIDNILQIFLNFF